eukprot:2862044-Amphidinium_carterae.1
MAMMLYSAYASYLWSCFQTSTASCCICAPKSCIQWCCETVVVNLLRGATPQRPRLNAEIPQWKRNSSNPHQTAAGRNEFALLTVRSANAFGTQSLKESKAPWALASFLVKGIVIAPHLLHLMSAPKVQHPLRK